MENKRIVVLVSGNGSNLQALIDNSATKELGGEIIAVISNTPLAFALERAKKANIKTIALDHTHYENREKFDLHLQDIIEELKVDLIVLAGYLRILSPTFVQQFSHKLINIHPSLLPKYPGLNTHQRALSTKDQFHGASVHFVTQELDGGPIIIQVKIEISATDSAISLAERVLKQEHRIFPLAIKWFCQQRLNIDHHIAKFDGHVLSAPITFMAATGQVFINDKELSL